MVSPPSLTRYSMAPPPRPKAAVPAATISRGAVYCDKDFWNRSAAWFVSQQQLLQQEQNKTAVVKTPRWASTATPTRVQPSRVAKNKKRYAEDDEPVTVKRVKITRQVEKTTVCPDYILDPAFATTSVAVFLEKLDTLLEGKRCTLARQCFWATIMAPSFSPSKTTAWCPIVARPLSCTEMQHCAHGMCSTTSCLVKMAPTSCMSPPPTPPPDAVYRDKPFAELRHIQERTVSLAGLRFAVDICNGMLRVQMV